MLGGTGEADAFRAGALVLDSPGSTTAELDEVVGQPPEIAAASTGEVRRRWLAERASRLRYCAK